MEKIRINAIDKKFGKPNDKGECTPFWAITFADGRKATAWDSQIADYMMNDVGIGGECGVELKQKDQFINIRAVDMTSAVKGHGIPNQEVHTGEVLKSVADVRGNSIIAQCLTKIEYRNVPQPMPMDIMASYRWYLKELD